MVSITPDAAIISPAKFNLRSIIAAAGEGKQRGGVTTDAETKAPEPKER